MLKVSSRSAVLAAAAISGALSAPAVHAATRSPRSEADVEVRVGYADLDIRAPAGAKVLMLRIASAAAQVCGGGPDSRLNDDKLRFERCRLDAYGRAVTQLDPAIVYAAAEPYPGSIAVAAR